MSSADHLQPFALWLGLQQSVVHAVLNGLLHVLCAAVGAVLDVQMLCSQLDKIVLLWKGNVRGNVSNAYTWAHDRKGMIIQMWAHLFTLVLAALQPVDKLSVDEVCADRVLLAVVPGGEDLLAEEETPGSVLLLPSSPLHLLLTLGDGVHHVLPPAAQSPHLQDRSA